LQTTFKLFHAFLFWKQLGLKLQCNCLSLKALKQWLQIADKIIWGASVFFTHPV